MQIVFERSSLNEVSLRQHWAIAVSPRWRDAFRFLTGLRGFGFGSGGEQIYSRIQVQQGMFERLDDLHRFEIFGQAAFQPDKFGFVFGQFQEHIPLLAKFLELTRHHQGRALKLILPTSDFRRDGLS